MRVQTSVVVRRPDARGQNDFLRIDVEGDVRRNAEGCPAPRCIQMRWHLSGEAVDFSTLYPRELRHVEWALACAFEAQTSRTAEVA